jgi:hypothetical protein
VDLPRKHIVSTSLRTADADVIVLRVSEQRRLVFKPTLVENTAEPEASVRGTFIYQRKRRADEWEDADTIPLSSLKSGEGYKLELSSAELRHLGLEVRALYQLMRRRDGQTPVGARTYVEVDGDDVAEQVLELLSSGQGKYLLQTLAEWLGGQSKADLVQAIADIGSSEPLLNFDAALGAARLQSFLAEGQAHLESDDESYWQALLRREAWVISQVYACPFVILRDQAYVGGKDIGNSGGSVIDFAFRNALSRNVLLVEIKTPATALLAPREYRNEVFGPSRDLSGATMQLLHGRRTLMEEHLNLTRREPDEFRVFNPRALLIIGTLPQDDAHCRCFETYRNSLRDLEIITFDELIEKVRLLLNILERQ